MNKFHHPCIICVIIWVITGFIIMLSSAYAAGESKLSATVTYTTEYIWHGYSKSDGNAVFQGNLDYHHESGFFAGLWFSQVDFGDDRIAFFKKDVSRLEFIPYFGKTFTISDDWHGDVQWNRYIYDDDFFGKPADYNEFSITLNYRDLLATRIGVTDDGYDRGGVYADYELTGRYPITDLLEFSTKVGYVESRDALDFNYLYWDAGVGFYYQYLALDFRYTQSSRSQKKNQGNGFEAIEPTFLFSVSLGY